MPSASLHFQELDRQQALVDLNDLRDDNRHGEILLDQLFVQVQGRLDELLVIVPIIPKIELAIERISFLRMFLFLELEQSLAIIQADWAKLFLEVVEELGGIPYQ